METKIGQSNVNIVVENGERVFPCRCGKTHRGDYASYDYGHHNCLHEDRLLGLYAGKKNVQALCPLCGMSWQVELDSCELISNE